MRNVRNWIVFIMAMAAVLSFTAGPALAQGFTIDFSSATGFGVSDPEKLQTNNVIVNLTNPLTGTVVQTTPFNLVWKFNYTTLALEIAGGEQTNTTTDPNACDALPSLTVNIRDALTGDPIEGASVQAESQSATTDSNGDATLTGLPVSSFPVSVSADGYVSASSTATLECGQQGSTGISLLPADDQGTIDGDIRVILSWGENPVDLDSHRTQYEEDDGQMPFPNQEADQMAFHIYWNNRTETGVPVELDVDDVSSYGPETITVTKVDGAFEPGTYRYTVHHFDGSSNIPDSGATVKVYQGDTVMGTYSPPAAGDETPGDNWAWRVFDIVADGDGNVAFNTTGEYYGPVLSGNVD